MNKKELREIPIEAPDWLLKKEHVKHTYLVRYVWEGIYVYAFFKKDALKAGNSQPYIVIFKDRHTWLNYFPAEDKFTEGSIDYATDWNLGGAWYLMRNLRRWQNKILKKRYKKEKAREQERAAVIMQDIPPLPKDFKEFCEETVMKEANLLVYNSKKKEVFCTHCKQTYSLEHLIMRNDRKPKHNGTMTCDRCHVKLTTISSGMSRKRNVYWRSTEIMQKFRQGIIIREFALCRDFSKTLEPETEIFERRRYIAEKGRFKRYEDMLGNGKWRTLKSNHRFQSTTYAEGKLYCKNLRNVFKGTVFDGWGIEELIQKEKPSMRSGYEGYMEKAATRMYIEQLYKGGLKQLAEDELKNYNGLHGINKKKTELVKMLGINKQQLRWLRTEKEQSLALYILQKANQKKINVNETGFKALCTADSIWQAETFLMLKNIRPEKALAYIESQKATLGDFLDHMELMKKLKIEMKKNNIYPQNFQRTHQDEIEEDILRNDKEIGKVQQAAFKETYAVWEKLAKTGVTLEDSEYKIVFPKDCLDIKLEGRVLSHCVGTYALRAARGETVILFMRKKEDVEKRLYTMEYNHGKLIQIRGYKNHDPEKKARELAEKFTEEFAIAERKYEESQNKKKAAV